MNWRDEILLREMELFETRDRQQTGPRAPLPEADDSVAGQLIWWQGLANSRHREITALIDKLHRAEWAARRYRQLFNGAVCCAATTGIALVILFVNDWLTR